LKLNFTSKIIVMFGVIYFKLYVIIINIVNTKKSYNKNYI